MANDELFKEIDKKIEDVTELTESEKSKLKEDTKNFLMENGFNSITIRELIDELQYDVKEKFKELINEGFNEEEANRTLNNFSFLIDILEELEEELLEIVLLDIRNKFQTKTSLASGYSKPSKFIRLKYHYFIEEDEEEVKATCFINKVLNNGYSTKLYFEFVEDLENFLEDKCSTIKDEVEILESDLGIIQLPNYIFESLDLELIPEEA